MSKREFVYQPKPYTNESLGGYFLSEKLDGMHGLWDGGLTRGIPCDEIPFANTAKDYRYKDRQISTGLWSRYAKPIYAPPEWLDMLPNMILDGELWAGRGNAQYVFSTVKNHTPDSTAWRKITYQIFNCPYMPYWLADGHVHNPTMDVHMRGCVAWAAKLAEERGIQLLGSSQSMKNVIKILTARVKQNAVCKIVKQSSLGNCSYTAAKAKTQIFDKIVAEGGEGVVLIHGDAHWMPERNKSFLKVKGRQDDEATVIGYISGEETDKGSKLLGMCGSLILKWRDKEFKLSGFTDDERMLGSTVPDKSAADAIEWALAHPKTKCPDWIEAVEFPIGTSVTFAFRELTDEGLPKEAAYLRKRGDL